MKNRFIFIIVSIFALSLSACTGMQSRDKPLRYEAAVAGDPATLAGCVVKKLYADSRPSMQLYHYKSQLYPAIETAQIFAYDTRFLPYIYSSNSPQNPDAIRDYISAGPEILPDTQVRNAEYAYAFALTIKKTDKTASAATIKGNRYESTIAWGYLKSCAATAD
ncbi:MAG: hypothetical protein MRK00_09990 [Nitrosomonas sp.]|nr:hypothetical protein [Nitrosomonas sp.]